MLNPIHGNMVAGRIMAVIAPRGRAGKEKFHFNRSFYC
jgi:hypothetical protein